MKKAEHVINKWKRNKKGAALNKKKKKRQLFMLVLACCFRQTTDQTPALIHNWLLFYLMSHFCVLLSVRISKVGLLYEKFVYPIMTSSTRRFRLEISAARSFHTTLFFLCLKTLRQHVPMERDVVSSFENILPVNMIKLLRNNYLWLLQKSYEC